MASRATSTCFSEQAHAVNTSETAVPQTQTLPLLHCNLTRRDNGYAESCLVPTRGRAGQAESSLSDAIQTALSCDSSTRAMKQSASLEFAPVLTLLKRSCARAMCSPESFSATSCHAPDVLRFLIDCACHPALLMQVAEIINILFSSEAWATHLQASGEHHRISAAQLLQQKLQEEAQAVIAMQHDTLLSMMPPGIVLLASEIKTKQLQIANRIKGELDRVRDGLEGRPRFNSSVQEIRFEPGSQHRGTSVENSLTIDELAPLGHRDSISRSTPSSSKSCDSHPLRSSLVAAQGPFTPDCRAQLGTSSTHAPRVGDRVEIFSNTANHWCPGYIEKLRANGEMTAAFQLPHARSNEWSKKVLFVGDPHVRLASGPASANSSTPCNGPHMGHEMPLDSGQPAPLEPPQSERHRQGSTLLRTDLPINWTPEELLLYEKLFQQVLDMPVQPNGSCVMPEQIARHQSDLMAESRLPRRALREVWQVANPELKPRLDFDEFKACCRLVGHCQAMLREPDEQVTTRIRAGGGALRLELRKKCLGEPPPVLPEFSSLRLPVSRTQLN